MNTICLLWAKLILKSTHKWLSRKQHTLPSPKWANFCPPRKSMFSGQLFTPFPMSTPHLQLCPGC